jgi:NADH dehydrogenase [ubiquinone] 1 alpha subcomplex assembly factor 1
VRAATTDQDLAGLAGLTIRIRGDGKRYKLTATADTDADPVMYQVGFETARDEWLELRMGFSDFVATYHGRPVESARPLDPARIRSLGLLIADGQEGPFRLEVDWVKAAHR